MLFFLIVGTVSLVYTSLTACQCWCFKYVQFIVCQLYLNTAVKTKQNKTLYPTFPVPVVYCTALCYYWEMGVEVKKKKPRTFPWGSDVGSGRTFLVIWTNRFPSSFKVVSFPFPTGYLRSTDIQEIIFFLFLKILKYMHFRLIFNNAKHYTYHIIRKSNCDSLNTNSKNIVLFVFREALLWHTGAWERKTGMKRSILLYYNQSRAKSYNS